jgi:WD40 repeat protein
LLAVACENSAIQTYEAPGARLVAELEGHQGHVRRMAFAPVGQLLASAGADGTTRLWDPVSANRLVQAQGRMLGFDATGTRLAYQKGGAVGAWEVADGGECRLLHDRRLGNRGFGSSWRPFTGPYRVNFHPSGRLMASSDVDGARLWDVASGHEVAFLRMTGPCQSALFRPDGTELITYGWDGLHTWPLRPDSSEGPWQVGPPRRLDFPADNRGYLQCAWAPSGRTLAVVDGLRKRVVLVRDAGRSQQVLNGHPEPDWIAFSPDERWLAAASFLENEVRVWDVATGRTAWRHVEGDRARYGSHVAFSPDGAWLVTGGENAYQFSHVGTWERGRSIPRQQPDKLAGPLAFRGDGRLLAIVRSPEAVQLLDPEKGREVATLTPPQPGLPMTIHLSGLAFSRDGRYLAGATYTSLIYLWDLRQVRARLAAAGLDWDLPPDPAAAAPIGAPHRSAEVQVRGDESLAASGFDDCLKVPGALEAEDLPLLAHSNCNQAIQDIEPFDRRRWSNGRQRLFTEAHRGAYAELELPVVTAGRYLLAVYFTRAPDYGQLVVSIDGQVVGKPFDAYRAEVWPPERAEFGEVRLTAGRHRLRFTAVGQNPRAVGYNMGSDCVQLQPIEDDKGTR